MIEIRDIHKTFDGQSVLHSISASFAAGQTNLVIGRSGSGKTVLLKCIVGLLRPDAGEVLYDGRNLLSLRQKDVLALRREMGMLFQSSALFDRMDVLENVMFPLSMFSSGTLRERRERASFCLERVGMLEAAHKSPSELSGGMQKRVAIARAIALNPRYLFCDEPNSGLDPVSSHLIDALIHSITHEFGITTVVNTHDMNSVHTIGESILFLHEGEACWRGSSATLDEGTAACEPLANFLV